MCEIGVLGEESVPGVHRIGTALANDVQNRVGIEVTLGGGLPAEGVCLVGKAHVEGVTVELGVHGNRGDTHFARGTDDAHRDFTTIGYQDFLGHEDLSSLGNDFVKS